MKKTVLHLSHTDIRSDSRILKELIAINSSNDINLYAIGIKSNGDQGNLLLNSNLNIFSVKLISKYLPSFPKLFRHLMNYLELNILFLYYLIKFKPNVIHCHDTTVLPLGVLSKLFFRSKLIYDAHELESNRNGQSLILSKCVYFLEWISWGQIDYLISVSESIIDWYSNNLGKKESIVVLNSPILVPAFKSRYSDNYLRNKYKISDNELVFIYLGIIGFGRGIEMYLEIFSKRVNDAHIVFIGYGEFVDKVKSISKIKSNIHYHEPVDHDQVVSVSRSADFGLCFIENVSLSDYYCLPNKLFEYSFAGLRILGSDFPELKNVITEYELGYYVEPTVNSISELINKLDYSTEKTFKKRDLTNLSWDCQANKLSSLYTKILNQ